MQILGEIPFIKPQNDTQTTEKRFKTMQNERKRHLVLDEFLQLVRCLEDCWHQSSKHRTSCKNSSKTRYDFQSVTLWLVVLADAQCAKCMVRTRCVSDPQVC